MKLIKSHFLSLCTFLSLFLILVAKPSSSIESSKFTKQLLGAKNGDNIEGLHLVRQYLVRYGYMNPLSVKPHGEDNFDDILTQAIKKYQHFFHLNSSGVLDENTLASMAMPRCGMPDFHYASNNIDGSKYTFELSKWTRFNLTWGILIYGLPSVNVRVPIEIALRKWASVSKFHFYYGKVPYLADLKFSFVRRDHGDGAPFDGPGGTIAHSWAPQNGNTHFDSDERWGNGAIKDTFDIETVALHEIGHLLGLGHSQDRNAIMWPTIGTGVIKGLGIDDIDGIKGLYP